MSCLNRSLSTNTLSRIFPCYNSIKKAAVPTVSKMGGTPHTDKRHGAAARPSGCKAREGGGGRGGGGGGGGRGRGRGVVAPSERLLGESRDVYESTNSQDSPPVETLQHCRPIESPSKSAARGPVGPSDVTRRHAHDRDALRVCRPHPIVRRWEIACLTQIGGQACTSPGLSSGGVVGGVGGGATGHGGARVASSSSSDANMRNVSLWLHVTSRPRVDMRAASCGSVSIPVRRG